MSLFPFFRKNKQESASGDSAFYSRAEEESNKMRGRGRRRQSSQNNQRNEPADPVLPEKKRARRRLIGAIALVLAAVVGLPMVLDSEPKPVADDIAIQIPSKDKPAPARAVDSAAIPKIEASASLDPKEEQLVDAPAAKALPDAKPAANEPAVKPAVVSAIAKAQIMKEAGPATEKLHNPAPSTIKADIKPESKTVARKTEDADATRAKALLEGKPDPKAADKKPEKFVIQVAALASKEKVDELQAKLKGAGIKSYTQKVATASGERIRIRVGPFATKEEADKTRAKIVKLGLNGTLVPA